MENKNLIIKESMEGGSTVKKKSKFLTFIFSFLPGVGHMYLGLTRQGIQLMGLFFLSIYLTDFLGTGFFAIFAPMIWFYSMFDVLNKFDISDKVEDTDISFIQWINSKGILQSDGKVPGIILVTVGLVIIFQKVFMPIIVRFIGYEFMQYTRMTVLSLLFILVGIKLLAGTKENNVIEESKVETELE